jgi:hypothetical protein
MAATIGLAAGCAQHRAPAAAGTPGTARVGWVIMHGDRDNPDAEFACQSTPRNDCVIPASREGDQRFSEVHLYFHPTPTETKYSGVVLVGFFRGSKTAQEIRPVVTVRPGNVGNDSVVGIVTERPGSETLSIDITAVNTSGAKEQIREQIPVIVR